MNPDYRNKYGFPTRVTLNPLPKKRQLPYDMKNWKPQGRSVVQWLDLFAPAAIIMAILFAYTIVQP